MATRLVMAWVAGAGASSIAARAAAGISRYARANDARLWHGVWSAIAVASLAAPAAALTSPLWQFSVTIGRGTPGPNAEAWVSGLALAAEGAAAVAAAGAALLLARLGWGCWRALRLAREGAPLDAAQRDRADRLVPGVGRRCRVHRRLRVPVAIGSRRGVVLLPESAAAWPDSRLRAILLHEQRHLLRGDFCWNFAAAAQQAVYWWNPLAWMIARRVRLAAELASDRDAASTGAAEYAKHLIATSQELAHFSSPHRILAPSAVSDLEQRVDALLNGGHAGAVSGRRMRLVVLGVAAAVVITPVLVQARVIRQPATAQTAAVHAARHAERHSH
jgi:hypothetical protein